MSKFIVETLMLHGWDNCWHNDESLAVYDTREEAEAELAEFLQNAREAGLDYESADYRITQVED